MVSSSWQHGNDTGFNKADFSWTREKAKDRNLTPSKQNFRLQIDEEVKFKEGAINLVIGPTGSGKTSVLMALLGEMHYVPRGPDSWVNLARTDGVGYAAQQSWIQSDTIKARVVAVVG